MPASSWCALAVGFLAFALSSGERGVALASWVWPVAFLWYARSAKTVRQFLPLAAAIALGCVLRWPNLLCAGYLLGAAVCLVWSVFWIVPYAVDRLLCRHLPGPLSTLLLPGVFVTLEYLRDLSPAGSFGAVGYSQAGFLPLVQGASVIGVFGLSFLVLWFAPTLLYALERRARWQGLLAVYLAILASALAYGCVRLQAPVESEASVRVACVIGPDYGRLGEGYDAITFDESLAYLVDEVERASEAGAEAAAWNEAAFDVPGSREHEFVAAAEDLATAHDMTLVLAYETEGTAGGGGLGSNKLAIIQPGGLVDEYVKTHLVPLAETSEYARGDGAVPTVATGRGTLSAVICFDDTFVGFAHGIGAGYDGGSGLVDVLFVPSWDWPSVAAAHTAVSRFRAVEGGCALVKPTYDGLSVVVDRYGRELLLSSTDESGYDCVRCVDVPIAGRQTPYGRLGAVVDLLFAVPGALLTLVGGVARLRGPLPA